jgi:dihydrofolate reductase
MMISADGFFEGENHDLSWHQVDEEFNEFAIKQTSEAYRLIFGRRTYELMKDYWPTEEARQSDPVVAEIMNSKPKIVFSKTLKDIEEDEYWKNITLKNEIDVEEIKKLKEQEGNEIAIFGSNNLTVNMIKLGLVDELRIMVNPVVIGIGTQLFEGLEDKLSLKLLDTREFTNGNILLSYKINY